MGWAYFNDLALAFWLVPPAVLFVVDGAVARRTVEVCLLADEPLLAVAALAPRFAVVAVLVPRFAAVAVLALRFGAGAVLALRFAVAVEPRFAAGADRVGFAAAELLAVGPRFATAGRAAAETLFFAEGPRLCSARMALTSVFTRSPLRWLEVPEIPRCLSWPRISSTRNWRTSLSLMPGVLGVRLPDRVFVAVAPRPLLR